MKRIAACIFILLCLCGTVSAKRVALTFDDGPSGKITEKLLDGLQERQIPATFFLCCYRITEHPAAVQRMAKDGHELGVHGCTHEYFTRLDEKQLRNEILTTSQAIHDLTGSYPMVLRPPGGLYNDRVLHTVEEAGLPVILWSVDPEDWDPAQRTKTVSRVVGKVKDGDIILLHDLSMQNVTSALKVADELTEKGFTFCTVSQLASAPLNAGKVYRSFP